MIGTIRKGKAKGVYAEVRPETVLTDGRRIALEYRNATGLEQAVGGLLSIPTPCTAAEFDGLSVTVMATCELIAGADKVILAGDVVGKDDGLPVVSGFAWNLSLLDGSADTMSVPNRTIPTDRHCECCPINTKGLN